MRQYPASCCTHSLTHSLTRDEEAHDATAGVHDEALEWVVVERAVSVRHDEAVVPAVQVAAAGDTKGAG